MRRFYDSNDFLLPRVVTARSLDISTLSFGRSPQLDLQLVRSARLWIFDVPGATLVVAFTFDITCPALALIPILEDCFYQDARFDNASMSEIVKEAVMTSLPEINTGATKNCLESDFHQLISIGGCDQSDLSPDRVQRLIYRTDLDYVERFSDIKRPAEFNRRPTSLLAMGPFVSVLCGQQDYVENTSLISAVQLVGASAEVRRIRQHTHDSLVQVSALTAPPQGAKVVAKVRDVRRVIALTSERLAAEELQLTFGVESACNVDMLIPSLRVTAFHNELADGLQLKSSARVVSAMLSRLRAVLSAEQSALDAVELRKADLRRRRWAASVGLLSTIAVPFGLVLSFFGGQQAEVVPRASLFTWSDYWGFYAIVIGTVAASGAIFLALLLYERAQLRRIVQRRSR